MDKEKIRREVIYVLNYLGTIDDSEGLFDCCREQSIDCRFEYSKERLLLQAHHLKYAKTAAEMKQSMYHVTVWYDGKWVFSSKDGIYVPGFWEELLHVLYEQAPTILANREARLKARHELLKKGTEIYNKTISKSRSSYKIGNDIEIKYETYIPDYMEQPWVSNSVFYKGNLVLEGFAAGYSMNLRDELTVVEYVPGEWEQPLIEYFAKKRAQYEEREKIRRQQALDAIRHL